jgi:hypothetical protein
MYSLYDFARCQRPDGTYYGTKGKCRKGVQVGAKQKEYKVGVTWGKFNIPTPGHARVIKSLLEKSERVDVIMSGAKTNVDWHLRNLMFRRVLKQQGVDTSRVRFVHARNTFEALKGIIDEQGAKNVVLALGEDRQSYLEGLMKKFGIGGQLIPRPEGSESSTMMRGLIDRGELEKLRKIYGDDEYIVKLARIVRMEEKAREAAEK